MLGQQRLQVRLDTVLHSAGVNAELVAGIVLDVLHRDAAAARLPCSRTTHTGASPPRSSLSRRRGHPVQRFVGPVVGMHTHRTVGLEEQQPARGGQIGSEAPDIVNGALGDARDAPEPPYVAGPAEIRLGQR